MHMHETCDQYLCDMLLNDTCINFRLNIYPNNYQSFMIILIKFLTSFNVDFGAHFPYLIIFL